MKSRREERTFQSVLKSTRQDFHVLCILRHVSDTLRRSLTVDKGSKLPMLCFYTRITFSPETGEEKAGVIWKLRTAEGQLSLSSGRRRCTTSERLITAVYLQAKEADSRCFKVDCQTARAVQEELL